MLTFEEKRKALCDALNAEKCFDLIERRLILGGRDAVIFYINGLARDELTEKILAFFYTNAAGDALVNPDTFIRLCVPLTEVSVCDEIGTVVKNVLSGLPTILIDWKTPVDSLGAISMDMRGYPQRTSGEAEDDKVLRGPKDGFVESVIFNTALLRRRIRDPHFLTKALCVGDSSKTDVVICWLDTKADHKLLQKIIDRISGIKTDALRMNQQSLIEALVKHRWLNPFPKVKYTERPDVASAVCLKGNIVILVDNSPSALLIPTSIFDVLDEADDYYFPPVTGTYIRISRYLISIASVLITPLWLLCLQNPDFVPQVFRFVLQTEPVNIPVFWQLIIIEIGIDGLRLASLHTPSSLTSALGIIGAIAFSQFAIDAGWFTTGATLYMSFATIANYSLPNFELGYSLKFLRIGLLTFTYLFNLIGFIMGLVLIFVLLLTNRTISGKSFLYPLIPLHPKELMKSFARFR
ncbi:MAG: spore germination protein [Ruminococcus sp.]|nr:spore germination protein [Ruminococcus sp.]